MRRKSKKHSYNMTELECVDRIAIFDLLMSHLSNYIIKIHCSGHFRISGHGSHIFRI